MQQGNRGKNKKSQILQALDSRKQTGDWKDGKQSDIAAMILGSKEEISRPAFATEYWLKACGWIGTHEIVSPLQFVNK